MSARFQVLDWRPTPMGTVSLRRRWDPTVGEDVYEAKLDSEFLMSSLFTVVEVEMARLALAEVATSEPDVVVGGLGLGYTARTVLENPDVRSLVVIEALGEVIEWHRDGLVPVGETLATDRRCRLVHGDFFEMVGSENGLDPETPGRTFDAVIVDIDHSPHHVLHPSHAVFYEPAGLRSVARHLNPGGVFALWSNDPPDSDFTKVLGGEFARAWAERVAFHNPLQGREAANTVYLATTEAEPTTPAGGQG
ncbi:spermine/spermidine synthase domain-containing protein [Halostreptopolyspora alba]|uniref:Spermidine synthase n=1 Tax=Halostreptopolyspora alba TaxID=2487137 RepID=A0A3N0E3P6_9ACTN|nr:spermidine synthase [Nocardiopsaceae bacterium YIM 96095]